MPPIFWEYDDLTFNELREKAADLRKDGIGDNPTVERTIPNDHDRDPHPTFWHDRTGDPRRAADLQDDGDYVAATPQGAAEFAVALCVQPVHAVACSGTAPPADNTFAALSYIPTVFCTIPGSTQHHRLPGHAVATSLAPPWRFRWFTVPETASCEALQARIVQDPPPELRRVPASRRARRL